MRGCGVNRGVLLYIIGDRALGRTLSCPSGVVKSYQLLAFLWCSNKGVPFLNEFLRLKFSLG